MVTDTEGIILRQTKTVNGRKMILLFSAKYGKISAGTSIGEKSRSKAALALRPFSYGRYELYRSKDLYSINGAEVIRSHYRIGEDLDKYLAASYVMEFTEKVATENLRNPQLFQLLLDFLDMMESRNKKLRTLVLGYQVKALQILGSGPQLENCALCGCNGIHPGFSIRDGGVICRDCIKKLGPEPMDPLICEPDFDIVGILKYFLEHPLKSLETIALADPVEAGIQRLLRQYIGYHLDIRDLKSEGLMIDG